MSTGDGTIEVNGTLTLSGPGNGDGFSMDLKPGTNVIMDSNSKIIVQNGAKMRAVGTLSNPVKFTSSESTPSPGDWDGIQLKGAGNVFEYTVLEYANTPLYFRNANNTVDYSTIRHNSGYGIRTYSLNASTYAELVVSNSHIHNNGSHGVYLGYKSRAGISFSDIKNNGGNGMYVYGANLGKSTESGSGYFRKNYIFANSGHAVRVGSGGKVYDGYGAQYGNNVLLENGSHTIKLDNSTSARWFDDGASRSEMNAVASLRYVYNLAQTISGETTVSWTVPVQYNSWNVYANPNNESHKFYGPVDFSPYLTGHVAGTVGPQGSVPSKANTSAPVAVYSAPAAEVKTEGLGSDEERDALLRHSAKVEELITRLNNEPQSKLVPRRLNGLLGYYNELPETGREDYKPQVYSFFDAFVEDGHRAQAPQPYGMSYPLSSQAVLMLELHQKVQDGHPEQALADIARYQDTFTNLDMKREIGFIKIQALEQQGRYQDILPELEHLSELSRLGIDPENTANEYLTLKDTYSGLLAEQGKGDSDGSVTEEEQRHKKPETEELPGAFALHSAYPNPFNPATVIGFELPQAGKVRIEVFDVTGRLVSVLTNQTWQPGRHQLTFNADGLASGVYLVRAQYAGNTETRKITLVK